MGVAHRDLKPENILLDTIHLTDGLPTAKIADFGLAKMGESARVTGCTTTDPLNMLDRQLWKELVS
jgi:serine/threonine protein kinase